MDPKIDTFCQIDICDLAILGVEKVVFWTFSKFFKSCLGSVYALFSTIKVYFWVYFQLQRLINDPKNWNFQSNMLILAIL